VSLPPVLAARMAEYARLDRFRALAPRAGLDFCSNDYLGFADDPELIARVRQRISASAVTLGSTGSRLVRGNAEELIRLEARLAELSGRAAALYFPSGYQANVGLLSAILGPRDVVFTDAANHASLIDGIRLSRCGRAIYSHLDLAALEKLLAETPSPSGLRVIITESIFSMDGDRTPLGDLARLARAYDAHLIVDEAHATGLHGERGGGLVQELGLRADVLATVHTAGKALGSAGAWIACEPELRSYLVNACRAFIYSTAPSPLAALALDEAVAHWRSVGPERVRLLRQNCARLGARLDLPHSGPIFPVVYGSNERALHAAESLRAAGFDVRAIRPPTVPDGTARLRITLRSSTDADAIDRLGDAVRATREARL
jgi:8-amino-7-oxononanoate synthase